MRSRPREALSQASLDYLRDWTERVDASSDKVATARGHWKAAKKTAAFEEIRTALSSMASGRQRCMYCEDNEGTDIDHFEPIDLNPNLAYEWNNYLLACSYCNSNQKRERFPLDAAGDPLLINPCDVDPAAHLRLSIRDARYSAYSVQGVTSIDVFGLNSRYPLVSGRTAAIVSALRLIPEYARLRGLDSAAAQRAADWVLEAFADSSFSTVFVTLVAIYDGGGLGMPSEVFDALDAHPELRVLGD